MKYSKNGGKKKKLKKKKEIVYSHVFLADQKTTKKIGNGHLTKLKFCR